jgi:hypothetical protein
MGFGLVYRLPGILRHPDYFLPAGPIRTYLTRFIPDSDILEYNGDKALKLDKTLDSADRIAFKLG